MKKITITRSPIWLNYLKAVLFYLFPINTMILKIQNEKIANKTRSPEM